MNIQITIEFVQKRCLDCGAFWAIESDRNSGGLTCPRCAESRIDEVIKDLAATERSMNAFKAVASALKNKLARSVRSKP